MEGALFIGWFRAASQVNCVAAAARAMIPIIASFPVSVAPQSSSVPDA